MISNDKFLFQFLWYSPKLLVWIIFMLETVLNLMKWLENIKLKDIFRA